MDAGFLDYFISRWHRYFAPMHRFEEMVLNMDESFLITASWQAVSTRMGPESSRGSRK